MHKSSLNGKVVMITRALDQSKGFAKLLEKEGAIPFLFPTIKTRLIELSPDEERIIENIDSFDCVVFSSVNVVKYFFSLLETKGLELPKSVEVAAVGPSTAALLTTRGIDVDLVPDEYIADSLVEALAKSLYPNSKVLIPRARVTREVLAPELERRGFVVQELVIYETLPDESIVEKAIEALKNGKVDAITFTSGSTVKNFCKLVKRHISIEEALDGLVVATIGPATAKAAFNCGIKVDLTPKEYTIAGLIDSLKEHFAKKASIK